MCYLTSATYKHTNRYRRPKHGKYSPQAMVFINTLILLVDVLFCVVLCCFVLFECHVLCQWCEKITVSILFSTGHLRSPDMLNRSSSHTKQLYYMCEVRVFHLHLHMVLDRHRVANTSVLTTRWSAAIQITLAGNYSE